MPQLTVDELSEGQAGDIFDTAFTDKISPILELRTAVKQVATITVGGATNNTLYRIFVNGISIEFTSDGTATVTEIVAGLVAAGIDSGANPEFVALVTIVDADPNIVITARVAGVALNVAVDDSATGDLGAVADTTPNVSVALDLAFGLAAIRGSGFDTVTVPEATGGKFMGVSVKNLSIPQPNAVADASLNATGVPVYQPGEPVTLLKRGRIVVDIEGADPTPATFDQLFFRHTVTDAATQTLGAFTTVDDANTDAVPGEWVDLLENASRAVIEINLP